MSLASDISENLYIDKGLAYDFLVVFSRFEYALKELGHVHKNGPIPRNLEVNYSGYALSIEKYFAGKYAASDKLKSAVDYFCTEPPRRQIWDGAKSNWASPEAGTGPTAHNMLVLVYRVRNNLFHGGKGWLPPEGNHDRDHRLMYNALTIIEAVLDIDDDLRRIFLG